MFRWIIISVLSVLVIGVAVWGYQEHQEKNAILIQAENNYQRAFHDLTYHIDLIHDEIGTVLAMNSASSLSPQLAEIWRLTSEAHSEVGQLPLALLPFNKTEEFLSNIGEFSYRTAVRGLDDDPLTDEEVKMLESLYQQSGEIRRELRQVQHIVLKENLRWMDVQIALATKDKQADNTIIDGFQTVEKSVEEYSEGSMQTELTGILNKKEEGKIEIKGKKVNEDDVRSIVKDVFDLEQNTNVKITSTGDGADIKMFSASFDENGKHGYLDITETGGYIISMIQNRDLKEQSLSLHDGMNKASSFLKKQGYDNMEAFNSVQFNNVGVYSFVYTQDGVKIYPDSVQVKVALDNGDIIGISAREYIVNHHDRDLDEPKLTKEEAMAKVNPNVEIQEDGMAVIVNDLGDEVLCYEFFGTLGDETYRIYINAQDGFEEQVEKMKQTEINFERAA
ncbi:germination protein YpeB [Salirhabdus salicampi]|uniref:germination protein YpeB n=1 Tax=Salirhabdus salicampi TaxID=476102 RepID=UPI0020C3424B|nr:germination protein YpeB [Salirhabdus salicampi]MCP8616719.1 germination protein YpeB [Salirhabdus salicampi]